MRETHQSRWFKLGTVVAVSSAIGLMSSLASANDKLISMSKSNQNWVMQGKDYTADHFSTMKQINRSNVKDLRVAWSFSDGTLNGHEGAPLVANGMMYVHTPFPNNTYAVSLDDPDKIVWENKPKQDPAARAVACCDVVNRGLAYWPGDKKTPALIIRSQLDGHVTAMNAKTGKTLWSVENGDITVGQTETGAPFVAKDLVIQGSAGAELGVRGYVTAYDVHDGHMVWRWYATGPDKSLGLQKDFNAANPQYGRFGLGTKTWESDFWKIGGGTNWGWYAYDPKLNMFYYGAGNAAPWNETMRPGDNKWTQTIWARDLDTGLAKFAYQRTPHGEWDYAGVNVIMLSDQKVNGKMRHLLTEPDRNGIIYTLDRTNGDLISANKIDDTVNWTKGVDLKTGIPVRDPEYGTYMGHRSKNICPSSMGYHNQGMDSYNRDNHNFIFGVNHLCMDWEPFMLPYRAGQFFVGANVWTYPGPKGDKQKGIGSGQVKAYNAITGEYKWEKMEKFSIWGGTMVTKGGVMFYGTLDGFIKARDADTGQLMWKFKLPSGAIGHPMTYTHNGTQYIAINYGVGGWPAVGLVFDLNDPSAGLGAVGAFKELAKNTQMGGGVMVFSLDGKSPYDDLRVGEYEM